jgi:hypothetical protein
MINNNIEYVWSELLNMWVVYDEQGGNTGSGNQGGNTGSGNQGGGGFDPRDES